jgi:Ca2+-binding RTX toxin-like protein
LSVVAVNGQPASVGQAVVTEHGRVVVNADGTFTYTPGLGCEFAADSFTYTMADADGQTASATVTIAITKYLGVSTSGGVLRFGGGSGADVVTVSNGQLRINGVLHSLAGISEVRVWGRGGNDTIDLSALSIPTFVDGGSGNDLLTGGGADDVIFGGLGDDQITGGAGNDLLLGGDGKDRIVGAAGDDILVAGDLGCRFGLETLRAISNAWASTRSTSAPSVEDLLDEIYRDGDSDMLTGAAGADLFILGNEDRITGLQSNDTVVREGDIIP